MERVMSKTYSPGQEADEIIARHLATGQFASADEVVRAGVQLLEEHEQEIAYLRKLIDEGDDDISEGRLHRYSTGEDLAADVVTRGASRSNQSR
jgi:antitoxin ParD1/3/4